MLFMVNKIPQFQSVLYLLLDENFIKHNPGDQSIDKRKVLNLGETRCEDMNWIKMAQDKVQWQFCDDGDEPTFSIMVFR
jgi:hypothetical protein